MKRFLLTCALVAGTSNMAFAEDASWRMKNDWYNEAYGGFDYQYTDLDTNFAGADNTLHGGNIHIGSRMHKNFGIELGYMMTEKGEADTALGTSETQLQGGTLDLLGYIPMGTSWDLIGTVGVSYLNAEYEIPGVVDEDEWETEGRVGLGAQYWLTDYTNLRGIVRYQGADFDGTVDDAVVSTIGLNFAF